MSVVVVFYCLVSRVTVVSYYLLAFYLYIVDTNGFQVHFGVAPGV